MARRRPPISASLPPSCRRRRIAPPGWRTSPWPGACSSNGALAAALARAATDADDAAFRQTLFRFVGALKDGNGNILGPAFGAGPPFGWDVIENKLVVTTVHPADPNGLKAGDVILSINDQDAMAALQALEPLASGATPQWRRLKALRLLMPNDGMPMRLRVAQADGSEKALQVARSAEAPPREELPDRIAELRPGLWYVDFARVEDVDFMEAVPKLAAAKAIIFDVRHVPTGMARGAVSFLTSRILRSGIMEVPVATLPDRRNIRFTTSQWSLPPISAFARGPELRSRLVLPERNRRFNGKFVFLTGNDVIGYGETMVGLIADEKLGTIVGEPTAGTNGNLNRFTLPGGYTVIFTGMRVTRQDGSPLHGVGIRPDIVVPRTLAALRAGRDEVLEKGIEIAGVP
jgi:C-terminal processing protease CtpA/Prc